MPGRIRTRFPATFASLGCALAVFGCGSDPAPPASAKSLVKQYVGDGDRICKAQLRSDPPPATAPADAAEALDYGERELAGREQTQEELEQLSPPAELETTVDAFHSETAKVRELLAEQNNAARADDEQQYSNVAVMLEAAFEQREKEAKKIGFEICGQRVKPRSAAGGAR